MDIQVSSNAFPLEKLFELFPVVSQPADADAPTLVAGGAGQLSASVKGGLSDLSVQAEINLDASSVDYGDLFQKAIDDAGNVTLTANLGRRTNAFENKCYRRMLGITCR